MITDYRPAATEGQQLWHSLRLDGLITYPTGESTVRPCRIPGLRRRDPRCGLVGVTALGYISPDGCDDVIIRPSALHRVVAKHGSNLG